MNSKKLQNFPVLIGLCGVASLVRAESPLLEAWPTSGSSEFAAVFETNESEGEVIIWPSESLRNTNTNGGQEIPVLADVQRVEHSDDWVYVYSTGLASHRMGPWYFDNGSIFGNWPTDQNLITQLPKNPVEATEKVTNNLGALGIWVNGVALFNMLDGFSYSNADGEDVQGGPGDAEGGAGGDAGGPPGGGPPDGGGAGGPASGDGIWVRNAMLAEIETFDSGNAHQPQSGEYHYHANPTALRVQLGDNMVYDEVTDTYSEDTSDLTHSPILGYAFDGFPVYGPYGYSNALDSSSNVARIRSGFQVSDGSNGTVNMNTDGRKVLPDWAADFHETDAVLSEDLYGPDVDDQYPLGWYIEDHAYLGDLGFTQGVDFDLDIYNGRFCVTPEYPEGVYAYFSTIAEDGSPEFPYVVGRQWYGEVVGGLVDQVTEDVELYYARGDNTRLANISSRASVDTGENVMIAGFVLEGEIDKEVLIRGIGPGLSDQGVDGYLENPTISLVNSSNEIVASNVNWEESDNASEIAELAFELGAFALEEGSSDSVLYASLSPDLYTVVLSGVNETTGVALAEVYDADLDWESDELANISTRAQVGAGEDVAIAGFVIDGDEAKTVLLRGIGPSLEDQGVTDYLSDPLLTLYDDEGEAIYENDDWSENANTDEIEEAVSASGAFEITSGTADSVLLVHLQPGAYTVHLSNVGTELGVGLVEIYEIQ
ncbi:YHYH protein [Puniceicoccaceae bacterium K14]|nr:YHYH protein [Puniceicoccaceae bacterium K14]